MAAKKYILTYEVSFKLHSGIDHVDFVLRANDMDDGVRKLTKAVILWAKKEDAVFIGAVLKSRDHAWSPLLPAVNLPN